MARPDVQPPDDDDPSMHPAGLVNNLRTLRQATSVDLLSPSTRSELDKLLLASLLGYLLAVSRITRVSLGGFEVETSLIWAVPIAVLLIDLYLIASFSLLAFADVQLWRASYRINAAPLVALANELRAQVKDPGEIDDGDPMAISEQQALEHEADLAKRSSSTPAGLEKLQLQVSIIFPIAFAASSIMFTVVGLVLRHG